MDDTIPLRFLATVRERPDAVALRSEQEVLTFADYANRACRFAAGLGALGVGQGDRVAFLLGNRPEFHVADTGALLVGATPISIYNSSSPEQIHYVLDHAEVSVVVVEDQSYLGRLDRVRDSLPALRRVVLVEPAADARDVERWDDLLTASPVDLDAAAGIAHAHDLATVIYTSGTTAAPKGVMLDHANVCWSVDHVRAALDFSPEGSRIVSYLPMAHIAERITSNYAAIVFAYEVATCADIRRLGAVIAETRPQILFGVPRTYEKIHSAVMAVLALDPARAESFMRALEVGGQVAALRARGEVVPHALAREHTRVEDEVLLPARRLLGLDALEVAVTAAAPITVEVLEFFRALGVPLSEMYGLSETAGPVTWEPHRVKPGTVGRPIPGEEVTLADDGEVLVRGGNVFRGYLGAPELTAEVLDADGWLHTGDVGTLDDEGYLRIVDRKKDLIITMSGENVSPANLEAALTAQPLIGQAAVFGDNQPYVVALLVLDPEVAPAWAAPRGLDAASAEALAGEPEVQDEVAREVAAANSRFAHAEQVRRYTLLPHEWAADSDELTPTMKLKRRAVAAKYRDEIAALYD